MNKRVDREELEDFLRDVNQNRDQVQKRLDQVKSDIGTILNMESFSGKTADQAKNYFSEIHITLLSAFSKLFDDISEQLTHNIDTFQSEVDNGTNARIQSDYLEEIKEDMQHTYNDLKTKKNSIDEIIDSVANISAATKPNFSNVKKNNKEINQSITELLDDLDAFTQKKQHDSVGDLMHQMEVTIQRAGANQGKARFNDYVDRVALQGLPVLQESIKDYERAKMFDQVNRMDPVQLSGNVNVDHNNENGIVEWKKGNQEISKGKNIDYKELGIEPLKTKVNGHDVHYINQDGNFIIFKDNPDLTYYTNGAEMGRFNYYMADASKFTANYYSPFALAKMAKVGINMVNPLQNAVDKIQKTAKNKLPSKVKDNTIVKDLGPAFGVYEVEKHIPVWKEIIGTAVPKVGTKEVILYISDNDGETWDGKMRFVIKPDGEIAQKEF
ncbi:T7SS effector LXG polymorphic toxin [Lentibacillus sp. N15]|uniref:T7SS effector LXG polymorphic toxin n=1 Tax=Lentibacillus songyuanensis TaxID=3136161 RepID=UPI0031BAC182